MRIISKFKDYYDSALSYGHDESVVFERVESTVHLNLNTDDNSEYKFMVPPLERGHYGNRSRKYEFEFNPFTVAFCGKVYPAIDIRWRKANYTYPEWTSSHFYDAESYLEQLRKYQIELNGNRNKRYYWDKNPKDSPLFEEAVRNYFATSGSDHIAFFAEQRRPIAVCKYVEGGTYRVNDVVFNPCLSDYSFYRVFNAPIAFQELDMFISGVMAHDGNPMEDISDEKMRDKKGFDNMSFKKSPTKKR